MKASRINVVGTSGSGKSTFSKRLAKKLNLPYVEMDKVYWEPNWTEPTDEKFFARLKDALSGDAWVLDGNYSRTTPIKWDRVETIIWLDYSFTRILFQAVVRALKRSITKEELWEGTGNRESFRKSFLSKKSIILWTFNTHERMSKRYEQYSRDPKLSHIQFIRLKSRKEAERFLTHG